MTEEEKKAIDTMRKVRDKNLHTFVDELTTVLNLIQKQQAKLEKKNKIIDLMTEYIDINGECIKDFDKGEQINDPQCLKCIKEYFETQVEREDKQ